MEEVGVLFIVPVGLVGFPGGRAPMNGAPTFQVVWRPHLLEAL